MSLAAAFTVDFLSAIVVLAVCFLVGRPLASVLPRAAILYAQLAAPILGFGWICVSGTILYRSGVSPHGTLVGVLVVAAIALAHYGWTDLTKLRCLALGSSGRATLSILLVTVLLAVLPSALGGLQFSAFQGNSVDQMNYLAMSITASQHPYDSLPEILRNSQPRDNFTMIGASFLLNSRPSISIGYAIWSQALLGWAYSHVHVLMAVLQVMVFLSLTFLVVNVVRLPLTLAAIVGAAGALGFFTQYVIDINAWSHLSSLSAGLVTVAVLIGIFAPRAARAEASIPEPSPELISTQRAALSVMLAVVPVIYLYPEMLAIATPAAAVAFIAVPLASRELRSVAPQLGALGAGIGLSLLCALGHWDATIGFLAPQIRFAAHPAASGAENNWHLYFQRYIFDPIITEARYHGIYAILAAPIDFFYGLLGLYFLRPQANLTIWLRIVWKLILLAPMVILIWGVASNAIPTFRRGGDRRHRTLFALVAAAAVLVAGTALAGLYWTAGKGFAMIALIVLAAMAIPLAAKPARRSSAGRSYALCFWALIAAHIAFGVARPIAARTGIHYQAPYPNEAAAKTMISWDIRTAVNAAAICRHVDVNIEHPILDSFVQMALTERGVRWTSQRPIRNMYGMYPDFGGRSSDEPGDCLLTTGTHAGDSRIGVVITRPHASAPSP
jgi:hypothetical protein